MQLRITSDANWETRTSRILSFLVNKEGHFPDNNYGSELNKIALVLMCRAPDFDFKRRVKFLKKSGDFYSDIMLNYVFMSGATMKDRMNYVAEQVFVQLSGDLINKKFTDFDTDRFLRDLKEWLSATANEYDGHADGAWQY